MKNLITLVALCLTTSIFAQTQKLSKESKLEDIKVTNVKISVEVDSLEEIESSFTIKEFEELLNMTEDGEDLSLKIKCNGKKMSNGVKSSMSYEIKGSTDDREAFLQNVKTLKAAAIKYYKSKN